MLEAKLINEIIIRKGRIESICFKANRENYTAKITPSKIDVSRSGLRQDWVCVYDRENKIIKWYCQHACGLQGFNPMLGDRCPACDSKTGLTDVALEIFLAYESKEPKFSGIMADLDAYCNNLEKAVKKI